MFSCSSRFPTPLWPNPGRFDGYGGHRNHSIQLSFLSKKTVIAKDHQNQSYTTMTTRLFRHVFRSRYLYYAVGMATAQTMGYTSLTTNADFFGSSNKSSSSSSSKKNTTTTESTTESSALFPFRQPSVEEEEYEHKTDQQYKGLSTKDSLQSLRRNFVAEAADIVSPSVVNIICEVNTGWIQGASSGSGFIYSKDGYIVTNAHVIAPSTDGKVLVTMWNGRKRRGIVHSMDKTSDIALIKLMDVGYDEDLPIAVMGSSGKLHIGEFVIALGSPLHLQNSITFGIVSATARHGSELGMAQNRTEFIQTDAAINVGNSGGPLVNLDGEVVGINSMKVRDSDGVSFAIPIDTAQQVIKQLLVNKKVIRPYVGLRMINFQPGSSKKKRGDKNGFFSPNDVQVLVVDVEKGSPAHRGGLQSGDLIVKVDGKKVKGVRDILDAIGMFYFCTFFHDPTQIMFLTFVFFFC